MAKGIQSRALLQCMLCPYTRDLRAAFTAPNSRGGREKKRGGRGLKEGDRRRRSNCYRRKLRKKKYESLERDRSIKK